MLALATFAGELLEVFDELRLGPDSETRTLGGDGFKLTREALLSVATQVIHPVSRDQGRACVAYRSTRNACSFMYVPQMCTYSKVVSTHHPSHPCSPRSTPIHMHALTRYVRLPLSSLQFHLASLETWFGAYSWHLTGHLHTSLAKSRTCWRKQKEGRAALLHRPHLHECGFITSTISTTIPSSFLRLRKRSRYAIYFPHYPDPTLIRRPHIQHESPSVTLAIDSILSCV